MQIKIFEGCGNFKILEEEVNEWLGQHVDDVEVHSVNHSMSKSGSEDYPMMAALVIVAYEDVGEDC